MFPGLLSSIWIPALVRESGSLDNLVSARLFAYPYEQRTSCACQQSLVQQFSNQPAGHRMHVTGCASDPAVMQSNAVECAVLKQG